MATRDLIMSRVKSVALGNTRRGFTHVASDLLKDWDNNVKRFVKVMPVDYKRMQGYMSDVRSSGKFESEYDIAVQAFDIHLNKLASAKA